MHWASWHNNAYEVAELIRHGADVNCRDSDGLTPLRWADLRQNADIVGILLAAGAVSTKVYLSLSISEVGADETLVVTAMASLSGEHKGSIAFRSIRKTVHYHITAQHSVS